MALLPNVFQPDEASDDPFAPLPADWYVAELKASELKTTKDGKGKYISIKIFNPSFISNSLSCLI